MADVKRLRPSSPNNAPVFSDIKNRNTAVLSSTSRGLRAIIDVRFVVCAWAIASKLGPSPMAERVADKNSATDLIFESIAT